MRDLFQQVETTLTRDLYYVALMAALAIPDICGAMQSGDGQATGERYRAWFERYVGPRYVGTLTGADCWSFRCSLLHQGSTQHPDSSYSRVIFVEPSATGNVFHNNILNDALNLDVRIFCRDVLEGAHRWLADYEHTDTYRRNFERFMHRYPNGLAPYIVGVPVFA
jgi:hypothetical protein